MSLRTTPASLARATSFVTTGAIARRAWLLRSRPRPAENSTSFSPRSAAWSASARSK